MERSWGLLGLLKFDTTKLTAPSKHLPGKGARYVGYLCTTSIFLIRCSMRRTKYWIWVTYSSSTEDLHSIVAKLDRQETRVPRLSWTLQIQRYQSDMSTDVNHLLKLINLTDQPRVSDDYIISRDIATDPSHPISNVAIPWIAICQDTRKRCQQSSKCVFTKPSLRRRFPRAKCLSCWLSRFSRRLYYL